MRYPLGTYAGLRLTAAPSALAGTLVLGAGLGSLGVWVLGLPPSQALIGALLAVGLHWLAVLAHHLGHAWAARRTGHPMVGIHLWAVLGSSVYPADEPPLPGAVHIRRALGGPLASLLLSLVAGALVFALGDSPPPGVWWALRLWALDNLIGFTLQAFIPLGFNDGSTILRWWPER